jgi:hypothetical protein
MLTMCTKLCQMGTSGLREVGDQDALGGCTTRTFDTLGERADAFSIRAF